MEESLLEIVDSTILKEIVGNIIGTKSAKLLFIWNTFNNWQLPTDGKLKLQVFAIFIRFPSTVLDFVRSRKFCILCRIFELCVLSSKSVNPNFVKKTGRALQRDPPTFPLDRTTVKFICKTFQSVEQEDKYRADKKVS